MTSGGVDTDLETCAWLWGSHSEKYAAGWLGLPKKDNELFDILIEEARYCRCFKGFDI